MSAESNPVASGPGGTRPVTPTPGQIITFYSYKGGTGRTMALANVACLVASGAVTPPVTRPVLMIDWDLEAPGLPRYFKEYLPARAAEALGVIDLFEDLDRELRARGATEGEDSDELVLEVVSSIDWSRYVAQTTLPNLSLMSAGRADGQYASRVNRFDWEGLFALAPSLMTAIAQRLSRDFSFVLIDSRTGHTDIKEICTTLLPDKLVLVFTPNQQSIHGAIEVGRSAVKYRMGSDDLRPLGVFPLVSRVEAQMDELRALWRRGDRRDIVGFQPAFQDFFHKAYRPEQTEPGSRKTAPADDAEMRVALEQYFDEVQIQQSPPLAYGEPIAALIKGGDRLSLSRSYLAFAHRLVAQRGPWEEGTKGDPDLVRRLLAHQAERDAAEARKLIAERFARTVGRWIGGAVLAAMLVAVVLWSRLEFVTLRGTAAKAEARLQNAKSDVAKLNSELAAQTRNLEFVRRETAVLEQIEQAAATLRSFEEFTFPARRDAKNPTDDLKERCQQALKAFENIAPAIDASRKRLEELVARTEAGTIEKCSDPDCVKLRDIVASTAVRTLARLRERTQLSMPSLMADRDFWQTEVEGWKKSVQSGEQAGALRAKASDKWEDGYRTYLAGDHAEARIRYEEAKSIDPTYAPPYNSLAVLELAQGNFAAALGRIDEALARDDSYPPAYSNRALIYLYLATGQPAGSDAWNNYIKRAEEASNRALELRPGYSAPLNVRERINSLKRSTPTQAIGPSIKVQAPPPLPEKASPDFEL